ncbi:MAG: YfhO family protein [Chloroflexota bacterium]|nr:YfhO family protein [Dehalococcoidia bacterium]MDW8254663.1 YfhO family protein [Chloroflexota bacterium]
MRKYVLLSYDLLATAFLFLLAVLFFQRAIFSGEIFAERDTRVFYFPLQAWFAGRLKQFELPLWSPDIFGGFPIFADGETGMFYPPVVLLSFFLPAGQAFIWNVVVHFFFAGVFTYCLCRALALSRLASVIGGVTFMFSGFLVAQIHHQNLLDSAVWLPLILCFIERAARASGGRRQINLAFAGAAFGLQSLAVHVQVPLMSALVIAAYCTFRWLLCPIGGAPPRLLVGHSDWQQGWVRRLALEELDRLWAAARVVIGRLWLWAWSGLLIGGIGAGLAAVQLLPLYELGTFSRRAGGVDYAFATLHPQTPVNLITLLLPYFFRSPDGYYWGLWSSWETRLYMGIAPLILAVVALIACRTRFVYFFGLLGLTALWIGMASHAPFFNLHELIYQLPGYNQMRAPGRYALVFSLAVAVLAASGFCFLERHLRGGWRFNPGGPGPLFVREAAPRGPWRVPLYAALVFVFLLALEVVFRLEEAAAAVAARAPTVAKWVEEYLAAPRMRRLPDEALTAERVWAGLAAALDPASFWVNYALILLFLTILVLFLWLALRPLRWLWMTALLTFSVVDLIFVGWQFHPTIPLGTLEAASAPVRFLQNQLATAPGRVYSRPGATTAPNTLAAFNIPEVGGYSSLSFRRHEEYTGALEIGYPHLLDAFHVRYVIASNRFIPTPSFEATPFDPARPLFSTVSTANGSASIDFVLEGFLATDLRVVSRLRNSHDLPQGTPVLEVRLTDDRGAIQTFRLLAGVHTSENAYDRPDVRPLVKHNKTQVAFEYKTPAGVVEGLAYYTNLPLGRRARITRVEARNISPIGDLQLVGMSLVDEPTRTLRHLFAERSTRWKRVYEDADVVIFENLRVLPRAYLVPNAIVRPPSKNPIEILNFMAENAFDPRREVLFERGDAPPNIPTVVRPPLPSDVRLEQASDMYLRIRVRTPEEQYLVVADTYYPGWKATIDGIPATIYRANYLMRGIAVPPGEHVVELRFEPDTFWLGFRITLSVASGVIAVWALWRLGLFARLLAQLARGWHRRGGHWRTFPLPTPRPSPRWPRPVPTEARFARR